MLLLATKSLALFYCLNKAMRETFCSIWINLNVKQIDSEMRTQNMCEKTNYHEGQVLNCFIKKTRTISDCEA